MDEFLNSKVFGIKWSRLLNSCQQSLYMVGWGLLIGTFFGLILALVLVLTRKGGVIQGRVPRIVYAIVHVYVNVIRSVPFVILLVFLIIIGWCYLAIADRIGTAIGKKDSH